MKDPISTKNRAFDSIICFGGVDWWYHNHGHYDLQIMRELSRRVPVLYVNSLGMRPPNITEGRMFLTRISRKLKSVARGISRREKNFFVFSPLTFPGGGIIGAAVRRTLPVQIRSALRRCGLERPLIWIACPPAGEILPKLQCGPVVYQRTDRYEAFAGVNPDRIASLDRVLKKSANLVVFCSTELYEAEKTQCKKAVLIDHGVDLDHFIRAREAFDESSVVPEDIPRTGRPRIGFIGGIDSHTFDSKLFDQIARSLPEFDFIMVGACSIRADWQHLANVHLLGQKQYQQVASYMAACDVLIMPWNRNEWIRACNPVKLKEYLAVGRPIVSTPFPELESYSSNVHIAESADDFRRLIRNSVVDGVDPAVQQARVRTHDWKSKGDETWRRLLEA